MVIVDASAVIDALAGGPGLPARVADRLRGEALAAPHLIDQEVMHTVRRQVHRGRVTPDDGAEAMRRYSLLRIHRLATDAVLGRAWALRDSVSAYDAAYLALAEDLGVPLITTDVRLGRGHGPEATVEVIA
jgi:predicted nucleic acid-binding protein